MSTPHDPKDPLNAWLDSAQEVEPSATLRRMIAEIPSHHPRQPHAESEGLSWLFGSLWKTATAALMVCVLGAVAGVSSVDAADVEPDSISAGQASVIDDTELAFAFGFDEESAP